MLSYEGIFFEGAEVELIHSLEKVTLPVINDEIHCTFKYHPDDCEIFNDIVGKEVEVLLVGYGFDGENSGFAIQLPKEMMPYYINYDEANPEQLKIPHITASLAVGAKASNTKNLHFEPLSKPIPITGKFGYWIKETYNEHISYDVYDKIEIGGNTR